MFFVASNVIWRAKGPCASEPATLEMREAGRGTGQRVGGSAWRVLTHWTRPAPAARPFFGMVYSVVF